MPRPRQDAHLHALARRGAQLRLREILEELKLLFSAFPDLRENFDPDELPIPFILRQGAARTGAPKRKSGERNWTSEQRNAAAARMKAYWAKRRAARSK